VTTESLDHGGCLAVEAASRAILTPFIAYRADDGRYVLTDKGRLSKAFQLVHGDVIVQREGQMMFCELKAEQENVHGNFFLEEWSNRDWETPGWMHKLDVDWLYYHFINQNVVYLLHWPALKRWAFEAPRMNGNMADGRGETGRAYDYPLRGQAKRKQKNDAWGWCVPIADLLGEVKHHVVRFLPGGNYEIDGVTVDPEE